MISVDVGLNLGTFDLDVAFASDGGITALFGRSGSGKSLTLSLIAGLARPDRGRISIDDRVLVDTGTHVFVPKHRRGVGFVFQEAHLFPHLSVRHNLMFGRWFSPRRERRFDPGSVIATLGIGHLLDRAPANLSGGEKQRVAIGRALLSNPKILLMDEPLAALDMELKLEILPLIERIRDELKVPIVYVSHAIEEVARLASRVVILEAGRVTAIGEPGDVFGPARSPSGESRFERSSVIVAQVAGQNRAYGLTELAHPAGAIWLTGQTGPIGRDVRIVINATDVTLATAAPRNLSVRTVLVGTIDRIDTDGGPTAAVIVALQGGSRLVALATRMAVDELGLRRGEQVFALVKTVALDERMVTLAHTDIDTLPNPGAS
jgi:molybdate transport system ATP-binding protein